MDLAALGGVEVTKGCVLEGDELCGAIGASDREVTVSTGKSAVIGLADFERVSHLNQKRWDLSLESNMTPMPQGVNP